MPFIDPKDSEFRNVLVWGPPRKKKTRFAASAPKPMVYFDIERGTASIKDYLKAGGIALWQPNRKQDKIGDKQFLPKNQDAFLEFTTEFNKLFDLTPDKMPKTVVVDTLTELNPTVLEAVLAMNKRDKPEFQDWGQAQDKIREIIRAGVSLPCNFILIGHEQTDKDELTGRIYRDPMTIGKLAGEIGRFFDDIFYATTVKDAQGKEQVKFTTWGGDAMVRNVGSRELYDVPQWLEPEWNAIYGARA